MKNRIRVTLPPLDVFFLPHVSDFLRIALGDSGSFPRLVKTMANAAGVEAPHLNTLKKAEQQPVTPSTAMKIKRVWRASIPDKQFLESIEAAVEPWNGLQLKNNGSSWVAALAGADKSKIGSALKGSRVASFLEKRMAQEKAFLDWVKQETSRQPNKQHDPAVWIRRGQEFLREHTLVDPELVFLIAEIDHTARNPEGAEWLKGKSILHLVNHQLRVDFYYTLLCELALDVADYLVAHGAYETHKQQLVDQGFVGDIAPRSSAQEAPSEKDSPLIRLFEVWKYRLSALNDCDFSYRRMASYLPLPGDCSEDEFASRAFETPADHKYGKLKRWRKGTIPDLSDFEIFIARLCAGHDSDHYLAWIKAQVALAWGRLIDEEEEALASILTAHPDLQSFNAIGSYSKYWSQYQKQAADISAA
ncbi:hypothetical protein [Marinobacter salsuginis]|uniref:Uncharacterized protein n=1 Tax=Marinobacter salsuginis TaxID=418719 RepID=A0A5M3Q1D3_9GAMM|nr:hypothetical protein [Marinobacter salsuginis]GBO88998.1 hypothetical protein MSSD14B_26660 [Marinobacter salsuginis]